jgi:predicted ester cyclase
MIFYNSTLWRENTFVINHNKMKSIQAGILALTTLLPGAITNAQTKSTNKYESNKNKEFIMNTMQRNKEVIQQLYNECLNKKNMALLTKFVSDDYIGLLGKKGTAGFEEPIAPLFKAFPDLQYHIEDMVAEDDKVVVRWKIQGTHTAQLRYFAPTGKTITNDGLAIYKLKDGKIIGTQVLTDRLGFLQALDVLPVDINRPLTKKANHGQVNFIDKFFVPAAAKNEFLERVHINRTLIKTLPGFIEDAAYEYADNDGNIIFVTVACWENKEALAKAKEIVQAEYKKQGFDMSAMLQRLHITVDRGIYNQVQD